MVPSSKVGLVIGKGGETIKSINQASGAHTEIDKSAPPDAAEKNFVIRGPPECVDRAKQMVMEKIGLIQVYSKHIQGDQTKSVFHLFTK